MDCDYSAMEMATMNTTPSSTNSLGNHNFPHHMSTVPEQDEEKMEESSELRMSTTSNINNITHHSSLNEDSAAFSSSSSSPMRPARPMSTGGGLDSFGSLGLSGGGRGPAARRKSITSPESISVLDEMMEAMALSFLIFLIADMRLMSATGRVMTKYEVIAVESDYVVRDTAAILSGSLERLPSFHDAAYRDHGLSPAQMFTTVLIELKKTIDRQPSKDDCFKIKSLGKLGSPRSKAGVGATAQDSMLSTAPTPLSGGGKGGGGHKLNDDMHSLLKAYAHMVGNDLADSVPHVEKRKSMINLMQSQSALIGKAESSNPSDNNKKVTFASVTAANNMRQKIAMRFSRVDQMHKDVTHQVYQTAQTAQAALANLPEAEQTRTVRDLKETTDTLFQMGMADTRHGDSLRMTLSSPTSMTTAAGASAASAASSATGGGNNNNKKFLSPDELLKVMENAVKSRVRCNLDFMSKFFRDGTLSQLIIQSQISIVWVNDWYPVKDLVYAIGIDEDKRRVLVVFRGAITKQDWNKAFSSQFSYAPNPIEEDFEDKSAEIDMHRGFYEYLFRVRKDTHTTKFDEIAGIAHRYGMDRLGPDYKLAVVGHSLGAALSTVFGFWASADARFTKNGPVKIFNFGSPMVGGQRFADCVRHQEKTGKLRLVRFYNHNDVVAHAPFNVKFNKRGINFRHVGVGVQVPPLPIRCCKGKPWSPDVFYIGKETFWQSYCRGIRQHMFLHAPWLWQIARMHTLAELLQRVMEGSETLEMKGAEFSLLNLPIEALYKELI